MSIQAAVEDTNAKEWMELAEKRGAEIEELNSRLAILQEEKDQLLQQVGGFGNFL